tara:strand:- start:422 stop:889 length:468 start_codon:yes stop_codon:yes gene_type:complete
MRSDILNENSAKYGGNVQNVVFVTDAATSTILANDSGKIHVMPDLTADCTITLPAEKVGLSYEFWYGGTAADAQDWIIKTTGNSNYMIGGLVGHDTDAGGDDTAVLDSNGSSNSQLSVFTPIAGTCVKLVCDGQVWYVNGTVVSATDTFCNFTDQ